MEKTKILNLIKQVQGGDQSAFAELYDEFAQRLYAFIRIKVESDAEAEDILQEVFLKAWAGSKNLNLQNLNFSAWLYKVAGNTINDYYRRKYRQPSQVPLEEARQFASKEIGPEEKTSHGLERTSVQRALAKLPQHYKEVIELRFFQDFTVTETANIMGKNSVTIRVWQFRALTRLKDLFKNSNDTPTKQ